MTKAYLQYILLSREVVYSPSTINKPELIALIWTVFSPNTAGLEDIRRIVDSDDLNSIDPATLTDFCTEWRKSLIADQRNAREELRETERQRLLAIQAGSENSPLAAATHDDL